MPVEQPALRGLRAGDVVAVRTRRWYDPPSYGRGVVLRQNRGSLTLEDGRVFGHGSGRAEVGAYEPDADIVAMTDEIRAMIEVAKCGACEEPQQEA